MNKMKAPSSSKKREKKKGNGLLDSRGKKKAKFNNSNPALVK
jgi:ribosomal protein L35